MLGQVPGDGQVVWAELRDGSYVRTTFDATFNTFDVVGKRPLKANEIVAWHEKEPPPREP